MTAVNIIPYENIDILATRSGIINIAAILQQHS